MQPRTVRTPSAVRAAIRLLADDDARVWRACRLRLRSWGEDARDELERAAADDDARLRVQARRLLRTIDLDAWLRDFVSGVRAARFGVESDGVLETGLRRLCGFNWRGGDGDALARRLDQLAAELRPFVCGRSTLTAARRLAELFAQRHDFAGVRAPGRSHDDWLPDRVARSGRGPASVLAAIYLLVARRAGVTVSGVLLPDFVLVRVHGRRRILVDPFHRGRSVTKADCRRYLRRMLPNRPVAERLCDVDDGEVRDRVL